MDLLPIPFKLTPHQRPLVHKHDAHLSVDGPVEHGCAKDGKEPEDKLHLFHLLGSVVTMQTLHVNMLPLTRLPLCDCILKPSVALCLNRDGDFVLVS